MLRAVVSNRTRSLGERHELVPTLAHGGHHALLERRTKGLAHGVSSCGQGGRGARVGAGRPCRTAGRALGPARPRCLNERTSGRYHSGGSSPNVMLTSMPCFLLRARQKKYQASPAIHAAAKTNRFLPVTSREVGSMNEK